MKYLIVILILFLPYLSFAQEVKENQILFENRTDVAWKVVIEKKGTPLQVFIPPGDEFKFKVRKEEKSYLVLLQAQERPSYYTDYREVKTGEFEYTDHKRIKGDIGSMEQIIKLKGGYIFAIVGPLLQQT